MVSILGVNHAAHDILGVAGGRAITIGARGDLSTWGIDRGGHAVERVRSFEQPASVIVPEFR